MGTFSTKENYFKFALYLVVIILMNLAGITLFFRIDLTRDRIYSLSDASKSAVATLSEPLTIKVFFSKELPAPHNNTERYLKDLLDEYAALSGRYVNYTFYNVTPEDSSLTQKADENRKLAKDYGIQPVQIQIMENDEIKFKNAYMGLVMIHGDLVEKIDAITTTSGLEYKLTTAIRKMNNKVSALLRLDEKIQVHLYLSSALNDVGPLIGLNQLPMLKGAIEQSIEKLNTRTLGVMDFTHIDVTSRQDLETLGEKYDLMTLSWPEVPQEQIPEGLGAAGLVVAYKGQSTTLPLISAMELPMIGTTYQMADPDMLEDQITAVVEKLIGINTDIGFLTSHGTHALVPDQMAMMQGRPTESMQVFNALLSEQYTIKTVDLKEESIPDGLNCLIIARPTQPFSDDELFQIDQALMKGTSLAFISDVFMEARSSGAPMGMPAQYNPIDTGLEKLLNHYGIQIKKAYVMDKQAYVHRNASNQGPREQIFYFAPHIKGDAINQRPAFMSNIKELVAMQIAPVELVEANIDPGRVTATRLLSSSAKSWLMEETINLNPMYIHPPSESEKMQSYDLAFLLEGEFTSYFKDRPLPKKEMEQTKIDDRDQHLQGVSAQNTIIETSKPARIFVLPSSQMIQDNMLDPQGRTTNTTFILNAMDHLNGKDTIAQLRSKQQQYNPISDTSSLFRGMIKGVNIIGLPVLVICLGLAVLAKRVSRKKKIANRFTAQKGRSS